MNEATRKNVEQERARLAKEVEKLERLEALAAIVPDEWPVAAGVTGLRAFGAYSPRGVCLEVGTRAEAVELAERIPAAPLAIVRLGTVGAKPVAAIKKSELERAEIHDEILPWVFEYSPGRDGGESWESKAMLRGYWAAPDGIVTGIEIRIGQDPARVRADHIRDGGLIVQYRWLDDGMPNGERIGYSSGSPDKCGNRLFYFWREPGGAAPTLADYMGTRDEEEVAS
jgi:hypothetical protein